MNTLIPVSINRNFEQVVSARMLHEFLEVGTEFSHWIKRKVEYGFNEGADFNCVNFDEVRLEGKREVKRTITDYILKLDMAKEICMLEKNEKGKQARLYFIQIEKDWNSPDKIMARALKIAERRMINLESLVAEQQKQIEADKPKVDLANAITGTEDSILVASFAKLLNQNGVDIGQNRLYKWFRENGYLGKKGEYYNLPTQKAMNLGLFETKESVWYDKAGNPHLELVSMVTGKGQLYFVNKFKELFETA